MVKILVLLFLFKGESSFVRGLWLLDLDNRKILLVEIFWISFASGVLRWWLESLLLPRIWVFDVRSIYFFGKHCLVYRRATSTWTFLQGFLNSLGLDAFYIRGFSLASMRSMISSCYFFVAFVFSHNATNLIWLTFVVQERGRISFLGQNVGHRTHSNILKLIGIAGIIIIKESTRFSR